MSSEYSTTSKKIPKRDNPYAKQRKRGPAFTPGRQQNPMLGAFESNGMHPITDRFYPVRHYTQAAADKRAEDLRRKGWDRVSVVDTKRPLEVKLREPVKEKSAESQIIDAYVAELPQEA